jgi:tetratricopeptide (TPR) repeat protein
MRKFLLVLLSLIFIFSGIYGTHYYYQLKHAKADLGRAVLSINEQKYEVAKESLKSIVAEYRYSLVKAPALFLLADIYEREGKYAAALEAHRILITHREIPPTNDWLLLSIIGVSKLYRSRYLPLSEGGEEAVESYIETLENAIDLKEEQISLSSLMGWDKTPLLSLQDNLVSLKLDNGEIIKFLKTELAFLYTMAHRYDDAVGIFKELRTNAALFGMAQIYFETGSYNRGIAALRELTVYDTSGKINALYLNRMYEYAEILFDKGHVNEALEIYKKIISLDHDSRYAEISSFKLAHYFYSEKKYSSALLYIDSTMTNTVPLKDEDAYLLKGYIYYDNREFYRALRVFDEFPRRFPKSPSVQTAIEWKKMCERTIKYIG